MDIVDDAANFLKQDFDKAEALRIIKALMNEVEDLRGEIEDLRSDLDVQGVEGID